MNWTTAADVSCFRPGDGECKGSGDRGVDGVAAGLERFAADAGSDRADGDNHAVFGHDCLTDDDFWWRRGLSCAAATNRREHQE